MRLALDRPITLFLTLTIFLTLTGGGLEGLRTSDAGKSNLKIKPEPLPLPLPLSIPLSLIGTSSEADTWNDRVHPVSRAPYTYLYPIKDVHIRADI